MTDKQIHRVGVAVVALMFVAFTTLGAVLQSAPWMIIGGWMGIAVVIELTWRRK